MHSIYRCLCFFVVYEMGRCAHTHTYTHIRCANCVYPVSSALLSSTQIVSVKFKDIRAIRRQNTLTHTQTRGFLVSLKAQYNNLRLRIYMFFATWSRNVVYVCVYRTEKQPVCINTICGCLQNCVSGLLLPASCVFFARGWTNIYIMCLLICRCVNIKPVFVKKRISGVISCVKELALFV